MLFLILNFVLLLILLNMLFDYLYHYENHHLHVMLEQLVMVLDLILSMLMLNHKYVIDLIQVYMYKIFHLMKEENAVLNHFLVQFEINHDMFQYQQNEEYHLDKA